MKLNKLNLKGQDSIFNVILGLGLIVVIVVLFQYNKNKSNVYDQMTAASVSQEVTHSPNKSQEHPVVASSPDELSYMPVAGGSTDTANCQTPQMIDPSELLPKDQNSEWSNINPASTDLKNVNMLNPSQLIGINTVGSSLRNANYQFRSEPANPRVNVGPWNTSTIEADTLRRPLEIGGCD
jgi:hypothetical protein